MKNLRIYGNKPFTIVVVHGGPGTPGEMAPIARELSTILGVIEPLQTKDSLIGQANELKEVLETNADLPVTLIGHSWGAMLSFILTGKFPNLVKKLILIGSGVYQEEYAEKIMKTRIERLSIEEKEEFFSIINSIDNSNNLNKNRLFSRIGELITKADSYDPITLDLEVLEIQYEINQKVWNDAKKLRISGELLELGKNINIPVVAIHGDYDPHPIEGIKEPLSRVLKNFKIHLLDKCGHTPWIERERRDKFFKILKEELK
ncbi:MAG: hypothetical protein HeimC3_54950 [Candidatus Heimdallarchaeota archaeon LC_3]|nr:MAG: hypothetical protein HeimC3_54950 [Candidatus Heimdallarchaeota archaeon LC_3]